MADFYEAFEITMGHEGCYSWDPTDAGGETYRGISRVYNPSWAGWDIIEAERNSSYFPQHLQSVTDLQFAVESFYKEKYWDINRLDEFDQVFANEIFDTGINLGVVRAAKFLQRALNYLNRNEKLFPELVDDGILGNKTFSAMIRIAHEKDGEVLLKIMNVLQGMHYLNYMNKSPVQEKYARGWFKRVSL